MNDCNSNLVDAYQWVAEINDLARHRICDLARQAQYRADYTHPDVRVTGDGARPDGFTNRATNFENVTYMAYHDSVSFTYVVEPDLCEDNSPAFVFRGRRVEGEHGDYTVTCMCVILPLTLLRASDDDWGRFHTREVERIKDLNRMEQIRSNIANRDTLLRQLRDTERTLNQLGADY